VNRLIDEIEVKGVSYRVELDSSSAYSVMNPVNEKIRLDVINPKNNDRPVSLVIPKVMIEYVKNTYGTDDEDFLLGLARDVLEPLV
jgi:hypothetical protein